MTTVARCGIYETRPQVCRDYPTIGHYTPPECTYTFPSGGDGRREGECACGVGACCAIPRVDGEPGGAPMPTEAGGTPCKHLVMTEQPDQEKTASDEQVGVYLPHPAASKFLRILGHDD